MAGILHDLGSGFLDLLYPRDPLDGKVLPLCEPYCEVCGEPFGGDIDDEFTCSNCRGRRWYIHRARAAYLAHDAVRELIHEFKYGGRFDRLPQLGDWLVEGFDRFYSAESWDGLVPVPLYPLRRRERGFNQAEELANWLSQRRGLPVIKCLKRIKKTEIQAKLRKSDRLRNQRQAFALSPKAMVQGRKYLIIDDVFTTGATVNACAQVLRVAHSLPPSVLTVARG